MDKIHVARIALARWIVDIFCSACFGWLAGEIFDYLTFPARLTFSQWLHVAPFNTAASNMLAAMAVLLFVAVRLSR